MPLDHITAIIILTVLLTLLQPQSIESHVNNNNNHHQNNEQIIIHHNDQLHNDENYSYNGPEMNKIVGTVNFIEDLQQFREELGKKIISFIDTTVDPCEDFYEYACGNWDQQYSRQEDIAGEPSVNFFISLKDDLLKRLDYILTDKELRVKYQNNKNYKGLLKARNYYKTCMRDDIFQVKPIPQYLELVKKEIGFPALDENWSNIKFDLTKATAYCNLINYNCLFKIKIAEVYPFCPYFTPLETFGINNDMKLSDFEDKYSTKYELNKDMMEYFLKLYGVDDVKIEKIVDNIMKFGHKLMNYSSKGNSSDLEIKYLYEIEESDDDIFDWSQYYRTILQRNNVNHLLVLFKNREFFRNFSSNLINEDDFETISNYLSLNVLHQFHIEQKWTGNKESFCLSKTKTDFSFVIAEIYRDLYENFEENISLLRIFDSLKEAQIQVIKNSNIYSEKLKLNITQKIENLRVYIYIHIYIEYIYSGYTNDPIIPELVELIENYTFNRNYYENNIKGFLLRSKLRYHHYLSGANNTIHPLIVLNPIIINASYDRIKNAIQLNAVGLRPPVYHKKFPLSVIYGATGQMMAHEISHAFDTDSIKLSENIETPLWTDDSKLYENRSKCFVQQYNKKYFPEVNISVNGTKTLSENIADNGGLKLAYIAYKNSVNQMTYNQLMKEILPYTDLDHLQIFFVAHAQKYCATYFRKQYIDESESPYSFMKMRVNVPLENLPEFGKSFNCPIGSKMNPIEKCSIF